MNIDVADIITLIYGFIASIIFVGAYIVKVSITLVSIKKDIEYMKTNQGLIIEDIEKIEKKVYK